MSVLDRLRREKEVEVVVAENLVGGNEVNRTTHFEHDNEVHIHAETVIVADEGIGDLLSGVEEMSNE